MSGSRTRKPAGPGRYVRRTPVLQTVDAVQVGAGNVDAVLAFLGGTGHEYDQDSGVLSVQTRHGTPLDVRDGDWLVREAPGRITYLTDEAFGATFSPEGETGDAGPAVVDAGGGEPSTDG